MSLYTVHDISMQYSVVNPIYNIESNALLNILTNNSYRRGALTHKLNDPLIFEYFNTLTKILHLYKS